MCPNKERLRKTQSCMKMRNVWTEIMTERLLFYYIGTVKMYKTHIINNNLLTRSSKVKGKDIFKYKEKVQF